MRRKNRHSKKCSLRQTVPFAVESKGTHITILGELRKTGIYYRQCHNVKIFQFCIVSEVNAAPPSKNAVSANNKHSRYFH